MISAYYFYVQNFNKKALLMATLAALLLCSVSAPRTVFAAATGNMAYTANGVVYYRGVSDSQWTTVATDSSDPGVSFVRTGEDGCLVYQAYSSKVYHKPSPTSTTDTLLIDTSVINFTSFAINKDCSIVWSQVDDLNTYESSVWYKSSPSAAAVEYEHNSDAWVSAVALTDNGGVAWIDSVNTLWYRASPTASIEQVSPTNEAHTFDMNGSGNITWQDPTAIVWYKATPASQAAQVSEPDVAALGTASIDATGGVAFTSSMSSIYYRPGGSSTTTELSAEYTTGHGVLTADGEGFFYENTEGGLTYAKLDTMTATDLTGTYVSAQSIDAY